MNQKSNSYPPADPSNSKYCLGMYGGMMAQALGYDFKLSERMATVFNRGLERCPSLSKLLG